MSEYKLVSVLTAQFHMLSPGSLGIPYFQAFFIGLPVCESVLLVANIQDHFELAESPGWAVPGCMFAPGSWLGQGIGAEPWV